MNDPRYDDHEQRIKKLEQDRDDISKNERLLLRLARYHRAELQELSGKTEQLELAQNEMSEELKAQGDLLMKTFNEVGRANVAIGSLEVRMERVEKKVDDGFQAIEKRFDAIADIQKKILDRLPEKE